MTDPRHTAEIRPAGPDQMAAVHGLFLAYAESLGFSLCFQGFDEELATLPGKYAPPCGGLWLAWTGQTPVGVVGLRPLDKPGAAELKRLYVRPEGRGHGLGQRLTEIALAHARATGYRAVCLDTIGGQMQTAIALYKSFGFRPIPPYYDSPIEGVEYYQLDLEADGQTVSKNRVGTHPGHP